MDRIVNLTCPGCGARVSIGQKECEYCQKPIIISTFNSVYTMPLSEVNKYAEFYRLGLAGNPYNQDLNNAIAMCYLKLKLYDKAFIAFEHAIKNNFDNSETYFYAAISLLGGKKAFLHQRDNIDKIEEYIMAAIRIQPKGIYYYFHSYIKYDYYSRKHFKTNPTYQEALLMAIESGLSDYDIEQFYSILSVPRPDCL